MFKMQKNVFRPKSRRRKIFWPFSQASKESSLSKLRQQKGSTSPCCAFLKLPILINTLEGASLKLFDFSIVLVEAVFYIYAVVHKPEAEGKNGVAVIVVGDVCRRAVRKGVLVAGDDFREITVFCKGYDFCVNNVIKTILSCSSRPSILLNRSARVIRLLSPSRVFE